AGTPFFMHYGVSQSADVPLSAFVISTVALICLQRTRAPDKPGLMVLAGFTAASAGWLKNEGLLFLMIVAFVLWLPTLRELSARLRLFLAFVTGSVPMLLLILWFKVAVAPPNDIVGARHYGEIMAKVWDAGRHTIILQDFADSFWTFGEWLVH